MMKSFFRKHKKLLYGIAAIWGFLMILFFANLGFSLKKSHNYIKQVSAKNESGNSNQDNWANHEIRNLEKEKLWLEQHMLLAKSDSFSLGINLKDSIVQVQLKGTVLFEAKMLHQKPNYFFKNTNKETYFNVFGEIARIDSVVANFSKRPIKKVQAPKIGEEKEVDKTDTVKVENIEWIFTTSNQIKVVIHGVQYNPDSTLSISAGKDVFNYRINQGVKQFFSNEYLPTLYIWLYDTDAKAIYRALPDRAKFVFRN